MAMGASLVALATDVDLQRLELSPPQSQAVGSQFGFKTIHFSEGKNSGMTGIVRKGVNYGAGLYNDNYSSPLAAIKIPHLK